MKLKISDMMDQMECIPLELREKDTASTQRIKQAAMKKISVSTVKTHTARRFSGVGIAAAAMAALLCLTAGGVVVQKFRNDILVSSRADIPDAADVGAVAIVSPNGTEPSTLEEMSETDRFKSDDWDRGEHINGGSSSDYFDWDFVEVLSDSPDLRARRVWRTDGAEKMEYTAEAPVGLLDALTGRVKVDLSWMEEQYEHVPDANMAYVITDRRDNYVSEYFQALYAKKDGSGYVRVSLQGDAKESREIEAYIVEGSYERAYYYISADGYEFLIRMHNGRVWVNCSMSHARIDLYGAYLTSQEIEDILDHLVLSTPDFPQ